MDQSTLLVAITEADRKEEKKKSVIENGIVENSMLGMLDRGRL